MSYYISTELYHHGILGQKWGVRRYQNEDGSLTNAGKKRYAKQIKSELDSYEKESIKAIAEYNKHDLARNRYAKASLSYRERNNYDKADKYSKKAHEEDRLAIESEKKVKDIDSKIWKTAAKAIEKGFDVKMEDVTHTYRDRVSVGSSIATAILAGGASAIGTFAAPGAGTAIGLTAATTMANLNRMINDYGGHTQNIPGMKYKVYASASGGRGQLQMSELMNVKAAMEAIAKEKYGG